MRLGGRKQTGDGNIAEDERAEKARKGNSNASSRQRRTVGIKKKMNDTKVLKKNKTIRE